MKKKNIERLLNFLFHNLNYGKLKLNIIVKIISENKKHYFFEINIFHLIKSYLKNTKFYFRVRNCLPKILKIENYSSGIFYFRIKISLYQINLYILLFI